MISRSYLRETGDKAVWAGIILLAVSLPLSKFGMSLGQFLIAGGWLAGGQIKAKFARAFRQPVVWVLWGLYILHLAGLIYTNDFNYAFKDLRIKLPLFLMPLFFSSMTPLTVRHYRILIAVIVGATLVSSFISMGVYFEVIGSGISNIRDISIFISHIRLSLLVCMSVTGALWLARRTSSAALKAALYICVVWLICFLFILESLTGLGILITGLFMYTAFYVFRGNSPLWLRVGFVILTLGIAAGNIKLYDYIFIQSTKIIHTDPSTLPEKTALGNPYYHDYKKQDLENGNQVWIYINDAELDSSWALRSSMDIYGKDSSGNDLRYTLIRYLASVNLPRDAEGISKLTDRDIRLIQNGIANVNDDDLSNLPARIQRLAWEYRQYHFYSDPSGHSFTQRLEFWKTAIHIIKKHPYYGVGTGDVPAAFSTAYSERQSRLDPRWRLRAHNQYLSFGVAFGIFGIVYFIFSLAWPWFNQHKWGDALYSAFLFIAACSMLTEDTLETQAGVTFFAFLNALLLFNDARRKELR